MNSDNLPPPYANLPLYPAHLVQSQLLILDSRFSMVRLLLSTWCYLQSPSTLLYSAGLPTIFFHTKHYSVPLPDLPNTSHFGSSMYCYMISLFMNKNRLYSYHILLEGRRHRVTIFWMNKGSSLWEGNSTEWKPSIESQKLCFPSLTPLLRVMPGHVHSSPWLVQRRVGLHSFWNLIWV